MLRDKSQGNLGIKLTEIKREQNKSQCIFVKSRYFAYELIANFLLVEFESKRFNINMSDKHISKRTCRVTCDVTWLFSASHAIDESLTSHCQNLFRPAWCIKETTSVTSWALILKQLTRHSTTKQKSLLSNRVWKNPRLQTALFINSFASWI